MGKLRSRRRLAAALVALAAAMLAVAGTVAPARASGPSMAASNGGFVGIAPSADIAVDGPNHSLLFYWQADGTPTWNAETVAGPGTTYSEPAMTVEVGTVEIAVMGPGNSLVLYSQVNGTTTWTAQAVAGPGTTFSAPSIAVDSTTVEIAAGGPNGKLLLYWAGNADVLHWNVETVYSPVLAGCCLSGPSITAVPADDDAYITWVNGFGQLYAAWATLGSVVSPTPTWNLEYIAGGLSNALLAPSIAATSTSVLVTYADGSGRLNVAWSADQSSTWNLANIAGGGTTKSAAPIAIGNGSIVIAATGLQGQLLFYWGLSTLSFHAETVAGTGSTTSDPALALNENSVNISALGYGGQLDFYWQADGSPTWNPEAVTGGAGLPLP